MLKTAFVVALCVGVITGFKPAAAGVDVEKTVTAYLTGQPGVRLSGKATLVHKTWKKALSEKEWETGSSFANEQEKAAAKAMLTAMGGVDFSRKQDQAQFAVMRVLMDHAKVRKDLLVVDEKQAAACKTLADVDRLFQQSPPDSYGYDGSKTVSLIQDRSPAGQAGAQAFVERDKIYVPEFWTWGASSQRSSARLLAMIRNKKVTVSGFEQDGMVHATLNITPLVQLEMVIDPNKENSLVESSAGMMSQAVVTKDVCEGYVRTHGGRWFPMDYRHETYVRIGKKLVLTQLDEYRAIPDSVEIDLPLPKEAFQVKLAAGTHVSDMRSSPSVDVVIPPGKDTFEGP